MAVEFGRHEIAPRLAAPLGVRNVARGLLEVGHQPAALEHLRQDVRGVLDGQVHAAELRDRVVAVLVEHPLIELVGALECPRRTPAGACSTVGVELVEEQPAQRLGRPRVAREQRALHRLRQIDQREDRPVEVREVRRDGARLRPRSDRTTAVISSSSSFAQYRRNSSMNVSVSNDVIRSKNSTPSRWSVSCWMTRAGRPLATQLDPPAGPIERAHAHRFAAAAPARECREC